MAKQFAQSYIAVVSDAFEGWQHTVKEFRPVATVLNTNQLNYCEQRLSYLDHSQSPVNVHYQNLLA